MGIWWWREGRRKGLLDWKKVEAEVLAQRDDGVGAR